MKIIFLDIDSKSGFGEEHYQQAKKNIRYKVWYSKKIVIYLKHEKQDSTKNHGQNPSTRKRLC